MAAAPHLPPEALDDWVLAASAELGLQPELATTALILDLARDVAHDVARPAAPVTAYLLGLAVGRGGDVAELSARLSRIAADYRSAGPEGSGEA